MNVFHSYTIDRFGNEVSEIHKYIYLRRAINMCISLVNKTMTIHIDEIKEELQTMPFTGQYIMTYMYDLCVSFFYKMIISEKYRAYMDKYPVHDSVKDMSIFLFSLEFWPSIDDSKYMYYVYNFSWATTKPSGSLIPTVEPGLGHPLKIHEWPEGTGCLFLGEGITTPLFDKLIIEHLEKPEVKFYKIHIISIGRKVIGKSKHIELYDVLTNKTLNYKTYFHVLKK